MALVDTISSGGRKVKIYSVTNRGNDFLKLSYHWAGQWKQRLLRRQGPQDDQRARAAARDLARAMAAGIENDVQDFTKSVRIYRAAEEALSASGMPVDIACREYAMAHEVLNGKAGVVEAAEFFIRSKNEVKERVLLRDAVEQFILAQKADGASEKYLQDIRSRMRRFANENEGYLHEINADQIQKWLRGLGVAPRTRNNFLSLDQDVLALGERRKAAAQDRADRSGRAGAAAGTVRSQDPRSRDGGSNALWRRGTRALGGAVSGAWLLRWRAPERDGANDRQQHPVRSQ